MFQTTGLLKNKGREYFWEDNGQREEKKVLKLKKIKNFGRFNNSPLEVISHNANAFYFFTVLKYQRAILTGNTLNEPPIKMLPGYQYTEYALKEFENAKVSFNEASATEYLIEPTEDTRKAIQKLVLKKMTFCPDIKLTIHKFQMATNIPNYLTFYIGTPQMNMKWNKIQ